MLIRQLENLILVTLFAMASSKIPVNLITGYLGVGKTTAILHLLRRRPQGGRWAVLVNEFGEVAIDHVALGEASGDGVAIREVAGGCLCCSAGLPMDVAVAQILRQARPERLLIETTGLGHPWRMLDVLRKPPLGKSVEVRATICLVDPRRLDEPYALSPTFQDQVHLADVLVANKTDLTGKETMERFARWATSLFPSKQLVAMVKKGELEPAWLDIPADPLSTPLFPLWHAQSHDSTHTHRPMQLASLEPGFLSPGRPYRQYSGNREHRACGWIFSPEDVFDEDRLLEVIVGGFDVERLKGVFRIGEEWILVNRSAREFQSAFVAYRRDSRLEVIVRETPIDWDALEADLIACLRPKN